MRKTRRFWLIALVFLLLVAAAGVSLRWGLSSERLRRDWARRAVPEIARQSTDVAWIDQTATSLQQKMSRPSRQRGDWVGGQMVVMQDGQWIIYRNECVHRHQLLGDIFVGKASNGRWYYSSYHFCCEMIVLKMMDNQPPDLTSFAQKYSLREFDGKSDEAIRLTWTPGSSPID